jgi:hypothetical protein
VRIKEEDINNKNFRMRYGHYEFTVVQFGFSNETIVFMCLMNGIFINYLGNFSTLFLDDILIYSKSKEDHEKHFGMVLQLLRENQLYEKFSK